MWVGKLRPRGCVCDCECERPSQDEAPRQAALASNSSLRMHLRPTSSSCLGLVMEIFGACFIFTFQKLFQFKASNFHEVTGARSLA